MEQKTEELIEVLDQLIELLESDGDMHWSRWMRKVRAMLIDSDYSGLTYLRSAYGGMGSFNDLMLGQNVNGAGYSWAPSHVEMNDKLEALRNRAAQLAIEIKRSL
ncbi:hypothetical protein EC919_101244 [Pseudomonas graminis]|uniref:DUF6966 domain-containing protein n=1 Tax=Pseudomonas graminis TaxID=158627 RepID=UPI0010602049|nr:hypothetical protein [Pseudomonas graminis]TDV58198.1 hypothetical protein EC919_101244 [Pseudomonas graminis]